MSDNDTDAVYLGCSVSAELLGNVLWRQLLPSAQAIKVKHDLHSLFYGKTTVGSDEWEVDFSGRLCRVWVFGKDARRLHSMSPMI